MKRTVRAGYNHPNIQKGWTNSSPKVGYSRGQLQDEDYDYSVRKYSILWNYILENYDQFIYDYLNVTPIVILEAKSLPVAIELAQWGYDVCMVVKNRKIKKKIKKDCKIHSGALKKILNRSFYKDFPRGAVIVFIGLLDNLTEEQILSFVGLCLRRSLEIVCAVSPHRDWKKILGKRYDIHLMSQDDYLFLSVKTA